MYDIYVMNFIDPTSHSEYNSERKLYSVPITQPENALTDPVVKTEMGKTGSFEFGLYPDQPYFGAFQQMKTVMRVVYDGDTIFRGRMLTIDDSPMTGSRKFHLEGDLAFLMDSMQPGVKDDKRPKITLQAYLEQLMNEHNRQMNVSGSTYKQMQLGEVPGHYTAATNEDQRITGDERTYGASGWSTTMDALSNLQKEFGGYFKTRYSNQGGVCYLDWIDGYYRSPNPMQVIRLTQNLIDISSTTEVNNLFTVVVPVGSSGGDDLYIKDYAYDPNDSSKKWPEKYITVPQIVEFFTDAELNKGPHTKSDYQNAIDKYGIIYKAQSFSNADTQAKLWNYMKDWILNNYLGGISNFTVSAIDMHHVNGGSAKHFTGDKIQVQYPDMGDRSGGTTPIVTRDLVILGLQHNLYNPEKNAYTIGIPNNLLNKEYGKSSKSSKKNSGTTNDGNVNAKNFEELKAKVDAKCNYYIIDAQYNDQDYLELLEEDPRKADAAIKATHMTLYEAFDAAQEHPIDGIRHREHVKSVIADGLLHQVQIPGPVNTDFLLTDDQIEKINRINRGILLNALDGELGLAARLKITGPTVIDHLKKPEYLVTAKVDAEDKSSILLYDPEKLTNTSKKASTGAYGDLGAMVSQFLGIGNNGSLDNVTGLLSGESDLNFMALFDGLDLPDGFNIENAISTIKQLVTGGMSVTEALKSVLPGGKGATTVVSGNDEGVLAVGKDSTTKKWKTTMNGKAGRLAAMKGAFGKDGEGSLWTGFIDGEKGKINMVDPDRAGSTEAVDQIFEVSSSLNGFMHLGIDRQNGTYRTSVNGANGTMASFIAAVGRHDSNGNPLPVFQTNASTGKITAVPVGKAGSTEDNDKTVQISSEKGQADFGKDDDHNWLVRLNQKITYTKLDGGTEEKEGFVCMKDINLPDVPSFKTKLAVIDMVVADVVTANQINADLAYIRKINAQTFSADTYVAAHDIYGQVVAGHQFLIKSGSPTTPGSEYNHDLRESIRSAIFVVGERQQDGTYISNGKITLDMVTWSGAHYYPNFNMADTTFFQDAVSAAREAGWAASYDEIGLNPSTNPSALNPGGSITIYPTGKATEESESGDITDKGITVSARHLRLRTPQAAVIPTTTNTLIEPGSDTGGTPYDGLAQVVVAGDENLVPEKIKSGTIIFGVTGNYSGGSAPTPSGFLVNNQETPSGYTRVDTSKDLAISDTIKSITFNVGSSKYYIRVHKY